MNLSEREVGFHAESLGFPSIFGCHAIVYVTERGLFGMHNFGGGAKTEWPARADVFARFVRGHAEGTAAGRTLYGVCFPVNHRGYGIGSSMDDWKGELGAFAGALGFSGPVYGYDLAGRGDVTKSMFVHYHRVGATCVIQVKTWNDGDGTKGTHNNPDPDYKAIRPRPGGGYDLVHTSDRVVTDVTLTGVTTVYPQKLSG